MIQKNIKLWKNGNLLDLLNQHQNKKNIKQAGAELGQAQIQLELGLTLIKI